MDDRTIEIIGEIGNSMFHQNKQRIIECYCKLSEEDLSTLQLTDIYESVILYIEEGIPGDMAFTSMYIHLLHMLLMRSLGHIYEKGSLVPKSQEMTLKEYMDILIKHEKRISKEKEEYVYFLECKHGVKIGKSKNLKTRINCISTQMPFKVEKVTSFKVRDNSGLEKLLHSLFEEKRLNGEWFNLNRNDISKATEEIESWEGRHHEC